VTLARTDSPVFPESGEAVRLACEASTSEVFVEIAGKEVLRASVPQEQSFEFGNVALRASARAYWDDVEIASRVAPSWLEDRLYIALSLLSADMYEADNSWTTARELLAGAAAQARTFHPGGDIDWISVSASDEVRFVRLVVSNARFGIVPEVRLYEPNGVTLIDAGTPSRTTSEVSYLVPLEGRTSFYARLSEAEGRLGTYDLRAVVVGQ
jgi:hypothetical protein